MSPLMQAQSAFLLDFCRLIIFARNKGFVVTAGELLRPVAMQKIYVREGRSKTMNSYHLKKLAGDLNFFIDGKYIQDKKTLQEIGNHWESMHPSNSWGGNWNSFKDLPHFERRFLG